MTTRISAERVLARDFLEWRARLLDLAAGLDRLDRAAAETDAARDTRLERLLEALRVLADGAPNRAERIQMLFSQSYDANWRRA